MTYYNARGVAMPQSRTESGRLAGTSSGNETIAAGAGDISLSGEGGGDLLVGASGDNRFFITNPNDRVQEAPGGGVDTVIGWLSLKAAPNVENLVVHMDFNYAVGNSLDNLIIVDGSQWVNGQEGDDVLVGSVTQRTTFQVEAGNGSDVVYNFNGNSQLQLLGYGFNSASDVRARMTQQGNDIVIRLSASETLTLRDFDLGLVADRQFLLPVDRSKLGAATFSEEFDTLSLVNPHTGTGTWNPNFLGNLKDQWAYSIVSNGEQQAYVAPGFQGRGVEDIGVNPFSITGGVLTITAAPTSAEDAYATWNRPYTSGMLNTFGSFEQKYGYFEMRAELPTAVGSWPAFWMMPYPYQPNVEADIMEALAATPNVDYRRAAGSTGAIYDNAYEDDPGGFHVYGMLWTPETVTFYRDGTAILHGATPANWTSPMSMIVNLAVGGWGGNPSAEMFPTHLKVDYIRAYALADGSTIVNRGVPEMPAATLVDRGVASGQAAVSVAFEAGGGTVADADIHVLAGKPGPILPPGRSLLVWEDSGAVFAAVSDGAGLAPQTGLLAGTISQFTGDGTWLSTGKVVFAYYLPSASGGHDLWDLVFDPAKRTFVRQNLGPAAADADARFVATPFGGFAVSWHAPDGSVVARAYDEYAYGGDIRGWYGPTRAVTGDLLGVTADQKLIFANGAGRELYTIHAASQEPAPPPSGAPGNVPTPGDDNLQATSDMPTVMGGAGNDTISGGPVDYLRGEEGDDVIVGGAVFDDIHGNMGNDTARGGPGDDWVVGGKDNDMLSGDEGGDIVYGNLGDDSLDGGFGADIVRGGQGNDLLRGGDADDWLSGDRGSDTITGGGGRDTFHTFGDAGLDRVTDFSVTEDRVVVSEGKPYNVVQIGADTVIDFGAGNQMVLVNVSMGSLQSGWITSI